MAQSELSEGETLIEPHPTGPMRLMISGRNKPAKSWISKTAVPAGFDLQSVQVEHKN